MHQELIAQLYQDNQMTIQEINQKLPAFPNGKLICSKDRNRFKCFNNLNGEYCYIPSEKRDLAAALAEKRILTTKLRDLDKEQGAFEIYLRRCANCGQKLREMLTQGAPMRLLLESTNRMLPEWDDSWKNAEFETNLLHPEALIHQTIDGIKVRSKAEAMIIAELVQSRIPYRYECQLVLDGNVYYPDFTIKHPVSGRLIYWEHFGLMDNDAYASSTFAKLAQYNRHGITPSINLIATFETSAHPLSSLTIRQKIEEIQMMG